MWLALKQDDNAPDKETKWYWRGKTGGKTPASLGFVPGDPDDGESTVESNKENYATFGWGYSDSFTDFGDGTNLPVLCQYRIPSAEPGLHLLCHNTLFEIFYFRNQVL